MRLYFDIFILILGCVSFLAAGVVALVFRLREIRKSKRDSRFRSTFKYRSWLTFLLAGASGICIGYGMLRLYDGNERRLIYIGCILLVIGLVDGARRGFELRTEIEIIDKDIR